MGSHPSTNEVTLLCRYRQCSEPELGAHSVQLLLWSGAPVSFTYLRYGSFYPLLTAIYLNLKSHSCLLMTVYSTSQE